MRNILLLTLLTLFACGNDELMNEVTFSGLVIETDTNDKKQLQGIKIDLLVPVSIGIDSILQSTTTDSEGKYLFQVDNLNNRFELYKIDISDAYYKRCIELLDPDMTSSGHRTIKRNSVNIWNLNACVTGKVETIVSKQSTLTKDTISIVVSTKYPNGTYFTDSNPISVTHNKQWTNVYFYNVVRSVRYTIELKKENGDIISWTEEKELIPKETITFDIE
ncbi:MAG: hypothetical protein HRU69_15380, partial [Flammeovirgaceae bacterium]